VQYELIRTCGDGYGNIEAITPADYVIAQDESGNWYGVFKNFAGASDLECFVIAITLDGQIFFSEEYCIERCRTLVLLNGCYGNLEPGMSVDANGIYFGTHAGNDTPLGDTSVVYEHKLLMRDVEVSLAAIKNTFKQGRTRTFRTEKEKIYQFYAEFVPEWYFNYVDAIFSRGEVFVGNEKYLLNETQYEKIDDCSRLWKPSATFKLAHLQSYSCEEDPCAPPDQDCCDPAIIIAAAEILPADSSGGVVAEPMVDIVVECIVGLSPVVTGTDEVVYGISDGSSVISCAAFAGVRVTVERGGTTIPGFDPGNGSAYYTKNLADNFITLNAPLVDGEYLYIQTIN
jgi:hypothetical protein